MGDLRNTQLHSTGQDIAAPGCPDSCPCPGHRPASDPPTTSPLEERIVIRRQHREFLVASHLLQCLHRHRRFSLQNCVLINFIVIIMPLHLHIILLHIILPWIALPMRRAVYFRRACVVSATRRECPTSSSWARAGRGPPHHHPSAWPAAAPGGR